MAGVIIKDITKVYPNGNLAVDHANLEVADGEMCVLLGPAKSGRTSLLRMISGLENITEGTISIAGEVVNGMPPQERGVAIIFARFALYPHLSIYRNLAFGLHLRYLDPEELDARVRLAAQAMRIEELLDRKPKALSGGQRQRVALGRALVRQPRVILLDEPFLNLDSALRVEMRSEVVRLHKELGITMIYATHDPAEADFLGGRVVKMQTGAVVSAGSGDC
jgi:ABC-type sugar transport system ATPase subunit